MMLSKELLIGVAKIATLTVIAHMFIVIARLSFLIVVGCEL
jgi:hypothetical protein